MKETNRFAMAVNTTGSTTRNKRRAQRDGFIALGGIAVLAVGIILVLKVPDPTATQWFAFRLLFAVAAGAIASGLPGAFSINLGGRIRGVGALAVFGGVFWWNPAQLVQFASKVEPTDIVTIAGRVIDEGTGSPIPRADVTIVGTTQHDLSDDVGNFRIDMKMKPETRIRLQVTKLGYVPADRFMTVPTQDTFVPMSKQR